MYILNKNQHFKDNIPCYASEQNIKYHFTQPAAPHQGRLGESIVKSTKHHITRILDEQHILLMDFVTLLTKV